MFFFGCYKRIPLFLYEMTCLDDIVSFIMFALGGMVEVGRVVVNHQVLMSIAIIS
jgi:hypothetical protein